MARHGDRVRFTPHSLEGIAEGRAWQHFEEWAEEDTYFSLEQEIDAVSEARFVATCVREEGPMAVVGGVRARAQT